MTSQATLFGRYIKDLPTGKPVLYPCDNYGFSVAVEFRRKAQCEGKGYSLVECCNAAAKLYSSALRVSLSMPTDCVTSLDKGTTLVCEDSPCRGH